MSTRSHEILGEYKKNYGGAHDQIRHQTAVKIQKRLKVSSGVGMVLNVVGRAKTYNF